MEINNDELLTFSEFGSNPDGDAITIKPKDDNTDNITSGDFFGTLLQSSVEIHKEHLKTKNLSTHLALDEFFWTMPGKVDSLIEAYQGLKGIVEKYNNILIVENGNTIKYLSDLRQLVRKGTELYCAESELKSISDDIISTIDTALYKLRCLTEKKNVMK